MDLKDMGYIPRNHKDLKQGPHYERLFHYFEPNGNEIHSGYD
jgi:hypothetical protein